MRGEAVLVPRYKGTVSMAKQRREPSRLVSRLQLARNILKHLAASFTQKTRIQEPNVRLCLFLFAFHILENNVPFCREQNTLPLKPCSLSHSGSLVQVASGDTVCR